MRTRSGVLLIAGPTAGGKTDLAIALAERYDAEIVGADSRQVYRDMPIGTAAPTAADRSRVAHHLVGFLDPYERYSAARFVAAASAAIDAIHRRGKRAIVVGGTGFYLRALCGDVALAAQPDAAVRARLEHEARVHPVDVLHAWLQVRDPERAANVSVRDPYRIVRALEVRLTAAVRSGELPPQPVVTLRASGTPYQKVALNVEPAELAARIQRRTDAMLAAGLLVEADLIGPAAVAADAVGYREALAYLDGRLTWNELRTLLTRATQRYAKRQMTWLRTEPDLEWLPSEPLAAASAAAERLGWTASTEDIAPIRA